METCNGNCNSCNSDCIKRCPVCHANSVKVPIESALAILKDNSLIDKNDDIYMCLSKKCDVTYFNNQYAYGKDELKVPVWFKQDIKDMIICYCYNITLAEIEKVVKEQHIYTKEEIIKFLKKEKLTKDCLHKNPIGKDCEQLFENAILFSKGEE